MLRQSTLKFFPKFNSVPLKVPLNETDLSRISNC